MTLLYPLTNLNDIYVDQASHVDGLVWSWYTPDGIRMLDSRYIERILRGDEDKASLRQSIINNPHLHWHIKNNLLFNLENR